jgi:hypothetical protein
MSLINFNYLEAHKDEETDTQTYQNTRFVSRKQVKNVRFQVLTATSMKTAVFCDVLRVVW